MGMKKSPPGNLIKNDAPVSEDELYSEAVRLADQDIHSRLRELRLKASKMPWGPWTSDDYLQGCEKDLQRSREEKIRYYVDKLRSGDREKK